MPPKTQNANDSSSGSGSLQCSFCGRSFSRPSHHDRHVRTHLPPEGRLSLPCDRCNKTFGRKDVLLRHLRTAHRVDPGPQPKAAQKSCYRCVQLRRKCDREQPCQLCAAGGAVCQYPGQVTADKTLGPDDTQSPGLPQQQQQQQQQSLSSQQHQNPDSTSMAVDYATAESSGSKTQATPVTLQDNVSAQMHLFSGGPSGTYPSHPHPQQLPLPQMSQSQAHAHDRHNSYDTTMTTEPTTMPAISQASLGHGTQGHDPFLSTTMSMPPATSMAADSMQAGACDSPSFSDDYYMAPDTLTFAGSLSAVGQLDFRGTGLDWLAFDVPEIYTTVGSTGMSGIDSTMTTEAPIPQLFQQPTLFPKPPVPLPPAPTSQGPSQGLPGNLQQYPIHHRPQQSSHQLDRPSGSQYPSHSPMPNLSHRQQGMPLPHASPIPPTPAAPPNPGIASPHSSYPPLPPPPVPHAIPQATGQVLPWPFEEGPHEQPPQRYSLPPLREVLQSNILQSTNPRPTAQSVLANLVLLVSDTRVQGPPDGVNADTGSSGSAQKGHGTGADEGPALGASVSASIPPDPGMVQATELLKRLVDTYITKFQPILPLLHLPTWDMATAPRVLVSAMACVGSLLADDENINGLTLSISDICMPMIAWMGSSDTANYRDISYLSALCVHQIFSLGSGSRQLYQNADRSRGILVGGLRGMGCLTTRLSLEDQAEHAAHASLTHGLFRQHPNGPSVTGSASPQTPTAGNSPKPTAALQEQWLSWMYREREKRTAWSSFEFDCSLCTLTGRRGAVDLSELPSRLPCSETLWDASSATAWAALRTRLPPDAQGALVSVVMRGALRDDAADSSSEHSSLPSHHSSTGTPNPHLKNLGVSFWGKRLCAQVIGRLLWDLKQLETLATSEYFGMPSLSAAQAVNKGRLLRALDSLLVSMDQPTTVTDLISYNIASLIGHYSHLYTTQDILDIILYIVRNTVAHGAHRLRHHKGIQMAKRRLVATLSRDPQEARRLVYHAAQIVAVANDYLVSAPCEILRLFMGYTFLIVFAAYCPSGYRFQLPESGGSGVPGIGAIQLDISSHRIASSADVDNWIAHGGPAAIGSVPNLFADGGALAICHDAQAIMQRLKNWGLAEKFTKILQNFESTALAELNA